MEGDNRMQDVEDSIICESCNKIVRPVEKNGDGMYTCPCCRECMDYEIERHLKRHGLLEGEL